MLDQLKRLEDAGLLTWVHRLTRIRRREQDLFGHWGSVWQVIRTSNGYRFLDPLKREPGRHQGLGYEMRIFRIGLRKEIYRW